MVGHDFPLISQDRMTIMVGHDYSFSPILRGTIQTHAGEVRRDGVL